MFPTAISATTQPNGNPSLLSASHALVVSSPSLFVSLSLNLYSPPLSRPLSNPLSLSCLSTLSSVTGSMSLRQCWLRLMVIQRFFMPLSYS